MKIIVTMDWGVCPGKVGEMEVFNSRGAETYQFTYTTEWGCKPKPPKIPEVLKL